MISKKQFIVSIFLASLLGALMALGGFKIFSDGANYGSFEQKQNVRFSNYSSDSNVVVPEGLNFIYASEKVSPAVVHVKTFYESVNASSSNRENRDPLEEMFRQFHGEGNMDLRAIPRASSGSGVIISPDGYIATNNHVVDAAKEVEVILGDKRSFKAKVVGTDPSTDLALLKIEAENLPFVKYGNSDKIRVGEWVLAIGNPFDLTSTVTAGIISAKSRNINIIHEKDNLQIESFLQTDAAVNPGNSGGALVNLRGELVGINTAIATETGSYAGYSFAVPVKLVKKVMDDLLNYGEVQRGLLGIQIVDVTAKLAEEKGLKAIKGVYVGSVMKEGAAEKAGLQEGDVITKIDDQLINNTSDLQAMVATHRPGDKISITYERRGKELGTTAHLKNKKGTTDIVKKAEGEGVNSLGAELSIISDKERDYLGIKEGVKINKLQAGKIKDAGIKEGFIITHIDKVVVRQPEDVSKILNKRSGGILIEGIYPDKEKAYYAIGW